MLDLKWNFDGICEILKGMEIIYEFQEINLKNFH